jgi:hypothetical protein
MSNLNPTELQRLRYWQGQMLRSVDFRDQVAIAAQQRWWHNRALHNAYGIAEGFQVSQEAVDSVTVQPGIAYDCFGRELILTSQQSLPIPRDAEDMMLLVQYAENTSEALLQEISQACLPTGFQITAQSKLFWKPCHSVKVRDGVPLACMTTTLFQASQENPALAPNYIPRLVRPLARPRIGSGTTIPSATAWKSWKVSDGNRLTLLGFEVEIDTSSAGFTESPCYFAWLEGGTWSQTPKQFLLTPFWHIDEVFIDKFTFRLWLPPLIVPGLSEQAQIGTANQNLETKFLVFAQQQKLYVSWLGIQPLPRGGHQTEVGTS